MAVCWAETLVVMSAAMKASKSAGTRDGQKVGQKAGVRAAGKAAMRGERWDGASAASTACLLVATKAVQKVVLLVDPSVEMMDYRWAVKRVVLMAGWTDNELAEKRGD